MTIFVEAKLWLVQIPVRRKIEEKQEKVESKGELKRENPMGASKPLWSAKTKWEKRRAMRGKLPWGGIRKRQKEMKEKMNITKPGRGGRGQRKLLRCDCRKVRQSA